MTATACTHAWPLLPGVTLLLPVQLKAACAQVGDLCNRVAMAYFHQGMYGLAMSGGGGTSLAGRLHYSSGTPT